MPFEEIKVNAAPVVWKKEVHPFLGATPIDIDGDGIMEIFVGGGDGQEDLLLSYKNNELVNIIAGTQLSDTKATHGANSIDLDNDGDTDLLLARNDGVYLYLNNNGVFAKKKIELSAPSNSTPLNVAVGDIDKDGDGDYMKNSIYNKDEVIKTLECKIEENSRFRLDIHFNENEGTEEKRLKIYQLKDDCPKNISIKDGLSKKKKR